MTETATTVEILISIGLLLGFLDIKRYRYMRQHYEQKTMFRQPNETGRIESGPNMRGNIDIVTAY